MINANLKQSNAYSKIKGIDFNNHDNSVFVFPFKFHGGFINVSEKGQNNNINDKPWNHNFFQKVFTGREVINVKWENSSKLIKPLGKNYYDYDFRVGKYHLGTPISNNQATTISANNVQTDFSNFVTDQNITLKFNAKYLGKLSDSEEEAQSFFRTWNLTDEDFFKIYLIPELGGNKWFYISNCEYFSNNLDAEVESVEVTFSTLSDKLISTGLAVEQYVQIGGPGEPYAYPKIEAIDLNGYTMRVVRLDETKTNMGGAYYCQVEFQGNPGIVSCYFMGRPANGKVEPSRHIFFKNFYTPEYNQINKTSTPSETFAWIPNCAPVNSWSSEALSALKNSYQPTESIRNLSYIKTDQDRTTIEKSNTINSLTGNLYSFGDTKWNPAAGMSLNESLRTYVTANYTYANDLVINNDDTFADILAKNAFIYSGMWILPLSYESNRPYYTKDIPIIGGFLNMLKMGDFAITTDSKYLKNTNLNMFMDYQRYQQSQNLGIIPSDTFKWDKYIPANFFAGDTSAPQLFNVASTNVSLFGDFTSKFQGQPDGQGVKRVWDTIYLGQTTDENFEPFFADNAPLKYVSEDKLVEDDFKSKIIDRIIIQSMFSGKVKITFFDEYKNQIWTTTIVTNSEWTGSILDYSAIYETTAWPFELCEARDSFTWPESWDATDLVNVYESNTDLGINVSNYRGYMEFPFGTTKAGWSNFLRPKDKTSCFYSCQVSHGLADFSINPQYYTSNNEKTVPGNYSVDTTRLPYVKEYTQITDKATVVNKWKDRPTIQSNDYYIKQNVLSSTYKFKVISQTLTANQLKERIDTHGTIIDISNMFFVRKVGSCWRNITDQPVWNKYIIPGRLLEQFPNGLVKLYTPNKHYVFHAANQDYNPSYLGIEDYKFIQTQQKDTVTFDDWKSFNKGHPENYCWFGGLFRSDPVTQDKGVQKIQRQMTSESFGQIGNEKSIQWQFGGNKNNNLWNACYSDMWFNTTVEEDNCYINVFVEYHNDFLISSLFTSEQYYSLGFLPPEQSGLSIPQQLDNLFYTIYSSGGPWSEGSTWAMVPDHEYTAQISIKKIYLEKIVFNV